MKNLIDVRESWSESLIDLLVVGVMLHYSVIVSHNFSWELLMIAAAAFFQVFWFWNSSTMLHSRTRGAADSLRFTVYIQGILIMMIAFNITPEFTSINAWFVAGSIFLMQTLNMSQWFYHHDRGQDQPQQLPREWTSFMMVSAIVSSMYLTGAFLGPWSCAIIWTMANVFQILAIEFQDNSSPQSRQPITPHMIRRLEMIYVLACGELILKAMMLVTDVDGVYQEIALALVAMSTVYILMSIYDLWITPRAHQYQPVGQFRWALLHLLSISGILTLSIAAPLIVHHDYNHGFVLLALGFAFALSGLLGLYLYTLTQSIRDSASVSDVLQGQYDSIPQTQSSD